MTRKNDTQDWVETLAKNASASICYSKLTRTNGAAANAVTLECSTAGVVAARDHYGGSDSRDSWAGSWSSTRKWLVTGSGDKKRADKIEKRMASLSAGATLAPRWAKDVGGYFPCVADAIGGSPRSMRRKKLAASDGGSITVFFPLNCSAAVSQDDFTELMCEVSSALCALATQRTVRLVCYGSLDCELPAEHTANGAADACFWKIPVDVQYLDARLLSVWSTVSVGRTVLMEIMRASGSGYSGNWPWRLWPSADGEMSLYRAALGATEQDMVIPPIYNGTAALKEIRAAFKSHMESVGLHMEVN